MAGTHLFIALSGTLLPGLGHFILGRRCRAAVFFAVLSFLFFSGVFLDHGFYTKFNSGLPPDRFEGATDRAWKLVFTYGFPFFVGVSNYLAGLGWVKLSAPWLVYVPGVQSIEQVPVTTRDIGYCFALLAGLLNLLVMMDAYDIAWNRDDLARRRAA